METQRTNIELDPGKLAQAKKITGLASNKAVVDFALLRLVDTTKALKSLKKLAGKVAFKRGYSYKRLRS